jgi:hypothetical protein
VGDVLPCRNSVELNVEVYQVSSCSEISTTQLNISTLCSHPSKLSLNIIYKYFVKFIIDIIQSQGLEKPNQIKDQISKILTAENLTPFLNSKFSPSPLKIF